MTMKADSALFNLLAPDVIVDIPKVVETLKPGAHLLALSPIATHHSNTIGIEDAGMEIRDTLSYVFDSGGSAPDMILVTVARKPLEGTVAENVLRWGTGGLNIDACRVGMMTDAEVLRSGKSTNGAIYGEMKTIDWRSSDREPQGRWPANLILQDCPIVREVFPDAKSGSGNGNAAKGVPGNTVPLRRGNLVPRHDTGSAARFFHSTPSKGIFDGGLHHLCKYLVRLITPLGGKVLTLGGDFDPVNKAATDEGFTAAPLDYYLQGQEKFTF